MGTEENDAFYNESLLLGDAYCCRKTPIAPWYKYSHITLAFDGLSKRSSNRLPLLFFSILDCTMELDIGSMKNLSPTSPSTYILLGVTLLAAYKLVAYLGAPASRLPPSPPSDPLIGHALKIPLDEPYKTYAEWGKNYGRYLPSVFVVVERSSISSELRRHYKCEGGRAHVNHLKHVRRSSRTSWEAECVLFSQTIRPGIWVVSQNFLRQLITWTWPDILLQGRMGNVNTIPSIW